MKIVGNPVGDDEDAMVGVVVFDVDGEPRWTGNGFAPCCPISVSPDVVGVVAAVKGTAAAGAAAAAAQSEETWRAMNIQTLRRRLPAM